MKLTVTLIQMRVTACRAFMTLPFAPNVAEVIS